MPFQKGISGNPRGRPRTGQALAEKVRTAVERRNPELLAQLFALALGQHDNPKVRVEAIKLLYTCARVIGTHIDMGEVQTVPLFTLPVGVLPGVSPREKPETIQ